jgi:ADP-ribose pyrophosphatase
VVYQNPFVVVHEDRLETPQRIPMSSLRIVTPSFACVVAVTKERKIVFVREYRPALDAYLLELPGGRLEPREKPEDAARRELEEETGYRVSDLRPLGWYYPSPARLTSRGILFLAQNLTRGTRRPDSTEDMETVEIPLARAYQQLRRGEIHDAAALIGLSLAQPLLDDPRRSPRSKPLIPRVAGSRRSGVG